jgi:ribose/xylose/arabinose/galactoside ABC-type transport system permease subunit
LDRRFAGIASRTLDARILAPIGLTALGVAFVICRNSGAGLSTLSPVLLAGAALAVIRQRRAARPHPAG